MATIPYVLSKPMSDSAPFRSLLNSVSAMAINAESSADAKAFAKAQSGSDVDVTWDNATATQVAAAGDMTGWSFRLRIVNPSDAESNPSEIVFDETVIASGTAAGVKAVGTLTGDGTVVSDGDTVTIGSKVYTFQATLTNVDGHVHIVSGNASATLTNLFHAINNSGGTSGTDYAAATTANTDVVATNPSGTTVVATAINAGSASNAVATTEASTHLSWGATTLTGGSNATVSGIAALMVTALNASALIAGAAYNTSTHVLTVAETTDSLGDHRIFGYWIAPNADSTKLIGVPGFIASQVDGGSAGDALTMTLVADTYTVPTVIGLFGPQVV